MKKFKLKKQLDSAVMTIVDIGIDKKDDKSLLVINLRDKNPRSPRTYAMCYNLECISGDLNGLIEHDTVVFDMFTNLRLAQINEVDNGKWVTTPIHDSHPTHGKVIKTVFDYFLHHQPELLIALNHTGAIDELFLYLFSSCFNLIGNNHQLVDISDLMHTEIATPSVVQDNIENIMSVYYRYSPIFKERKGCEGYLDQVFWNLLQCLTSCTTISFENKKEKGLNHYVKNNLPFDHQKLLNVLDSSMSYFAPNQIRYELCALTNVSKDFPDAISCQNADALAAALKNKESGNGSHNVWLSRNAKAYFLSDNFLGINADGSFKLAVNVFILCRVFVSATYRNYMIDNLNDQIIHDVVKETSFAVRNLFKRWGAKGEVEPEVTILGGLYKLKLCKSLNSDKQAGLIITVDDRILNALPEDLVLS